MKAINTGEGIDFEDERWGTCKGNEKDRPESAVRK
jgi:hypothetical protein